MLSKEANERLSRVGPGTPMGELFRRFWLPAVLTSELEADGAPTRLRILGEDLIAFRNTEGKVGITSAYCAHRLAPLFFGRNENCGIRCAYHGWKFDVDGNCVETPNVPAGGPDIRKNVGIKAYATHEASGVVWIHMGPKHLVQPFPKFEYGEAQPGYHMNARWLQRTNWSQGMEGEIDSSHISWLHQDFDKDTSAQKVVGSQMSDDRSPVIELRETPYGFTYGARRQLGEEYLWRVTQWLVPMFSLIPREPGPFKTCGGRAWVPIDDNHTTVFTFGYRVDRPYTEAEQKLFWSGALFPPRMAKGRYTLPDGYIIDTYLPEANRENDFELSRDMQKSINFSGIWGIHDQDRALSENSLAIGPEDPGIVDRSGEHLVSSDRPVVTARRRLLKMAEDLENGVEPLVASQGELFGVRAISRVSTIEDFDEFLGEFASDARLPSGVVAEPGKRTRAKQARD